MLSSSKAWGIFDSNTSFVNFTLRIVHVMKKYKYKLYTNSCTEVQSIKINIIRRNH